MKKNLKNNKTMSYNKKSQVNLAIEFNRDLKRIIEQLSTRKRSTKQKNELAKNFTLKLIKSYQVRNGRKYTEIEINYIISRIMNMQEFTKKKLLRDLFVPKNEILKYLGISKPHGPIKTESDKEFLKNLKDFEKKTGIN